jgi:hypothetical protein
MARSIPNRQRLRVSCARTPRPQSTGCGRGTCPAPDCRRPGQTESRTPSHLSSRAHRTLNTEHRHRDLPRYGLACGEEACRLGSFVGLSLEGRIRQASGYPKTRLYRHTHRPTVQIRQGGSSQIPQGRAPGASTMGPGGRRAQYNATGASPLQKSPRQADPAIVADR